jgi:hypothetical protein
MKELLSDLIGPVTGIINKVVPDKDEAARLAHEISTMATVTRRSWPWIRSRTPHATALTATMTGAFAV